MVNIKKNKAVVVAMSGGVDSSVAAALLKEQGYDLIGITMKTWGYDDIPERDSGCCSLETIYSARSVADSLGFPHYTLDFTDRFNETVIDNFITEYMRGYTPNPCVLCNKVIKWGALLEKAESLGADYIATGHYAKINSENGRYFVTTAADSNKDQSYALWRVSQYALSKTLFPLGEYTKPEIRQMAKKLNLKSADTPDSQEICFVPNEDYRALLELRLPEKMESLSEGDVLYHEEKVGTHKGFPYYTIGQRRGLNIALGKPVYVSKLDPEKNVVFIDDEEGLYKTGFITKESNMLKLERLDTPTEMNVKIRYNDNGSAAIVEQLDDERFRVIFKDKKKSIAPGQSAVFYVDGDVIGGGIIDEIIN